MSSMSCKLMALHWLTTYSRFSLILNMPRNNKTLWSRMQGPYVLHCAQLKWLLSFLGCGKWLRTNDPCYWTVEGSRKSKFSQNWLERWWQPPCAVVGQLHLLSGTCRDGALITLFQISSWDGMLNDSMIKKHWWHCIHIWQEGALKSTCRSLTCHSQTNVNYKLCQSPACLKKFYNLLIWTWLLVRLMSVWLGRSLHFWIIFIVWQKND